MKNLGYTYGGIEAWLSLVERRVRDAEAASSNLVASIIPLMIDTQIYGLLVKGLRRRPLTAETGVRFPYLLLQRSLKTLNYQWFSGFYFLCVLKSNQEFIVRTLGQEGHRFLPDPARA